MSTPALAASRLAWLYPVVLIRGALIIGLVLILAISAFIPSAAPFVPFVLLTATAGWFLFRHPDVNLFVVIGSFVFVARFDEGVDIFEVAYTLFYAGYLVQWFFRRVVLSPEPLVRSYVDILVLTFLVLVTFYAGIGFVFGAGLINVVAELQSWTLLAFYFPIKEAVERSESGAKWLIITLAAVGVMVVLRNLWMLNQLLSSATQAWQITVKGRIVANEMLMVVPAFCMLVMAMTAGRRKSQLVYFGLFLIMLFGIIVTQGRGYWLGLAFGLGVLFLIVDSRMRKAMLGWGALGLVGCSALIFLLFGEYALLLAAGLVSRLLSIGSAATSDISLLGRFIEWKSAMADVFKNPILGYGMGVPISYYDLSHTATMVRPWIHNGYISLWFKYGILGLGLMLTLTGLSIRNAIRAAGQARSSRLIRVCGYTAAAGLCSLLVSTIPSNAWYNSDTILMLAVLTGMSSGCYARKHA
jgi:O-antigen ligase